MRTRESGQLNERAGHLQRNYRDSALPGGTREGEGRRSANRALQLQSAQAQIKQRVGRQLNEPPLQQPGKYLEYFQNMYSKRTVSAITGSEMAKPQICNPEVWA